MVIRNNGGLYIEGHKGRKGERERQIENTWYVKKRTVVNGHLRGNPQIFRSLNTESATQPVKPAVYGLWLSKFEKLSLTNL